MNKDFRSIIVGYGTQGIKRAKIIGKDVFALVDINNNNLNFKNVQDVPLDKYDIALVCTGDKAKIDIIKYLLQNKKHVLVEKPLLTENSKDLIEIDRLSKKNHVACYTAYNHRFEPHFIKMEDALKSKILGKVYSIRMFYGNGTARLVKNSLWRDKDTGVLTDLGSHLLDTLDYWVDGIRKLDFNVTAAFCHENKSFDHVIISHAGKYSIQLEVSLLSWKNSFICDVLCEKGSLHINSLCKWGPSTFTIRKRVLPSGIPIEENFTLNQKDPTWEDEYKFFLSLCRKEQDNTVAKDIWLNNTLKQLSENINVKQI